MNRTGLVVLMVTGLAATSLPAQPVLSLGADPERSCESPSLGEKLRLFHPLGATRIADSQCLGGDHAWVPTAPMDLAQREVWRQALGSLQASIRPRCRLAGAMLDRLDRADRVSVWTAVDTAGGRIYFGAAYLSAGAEPLAVQFWAPAFERSLDWFVVAAAHEALHLLRPTASEEEATAFGAGCAGAVALAGISRSAGGGR